MKRHFTPIFCCLCGIVFLSSCATHNDYAATTNDYANFYAPIENQPPATPLPKSSIQLIEDVENDILLQKLLDSGNYQVLGYSTFRGEWKPRALAINQAQQIGASIIVVKSSFYDAETRTWTSMVPISNTTYHQGTLYGSYGGYSTYSGTSTTQSYIPVTRSQTYIYYEQTAHFLAEKPTHP